MFAGISGGLRWIPEGFRLHPGGNFLGQEFDQQVGQQLAQRLRKPWVTRAFAMSTKSADRSGMTMKALWHGPWRLVTAVMVAMAVIGIAGQACLIRGYAVGEASALAASRA